MATSNTEELSQVLARVNAANLDFVRFTFADIHGQPRGKTIPARNVHFVLTEGLSAYAGATAFGPTHEYVVIDEILEVKHDNMEIIPDLTTFCILPWAGGEEYKIGEFQCEGQWAKDGTPQESCTRFLANKQLNRLKSMGYQLFSTWEQEFQLLHKQDQTPVFPGNPYMYNYHVEQNRKVIYKLDKLALAGGINVESYQTEYSPGQFEITIFPQQGIKAADDAFTFRQAVKEIADQNDMEAIFLAKSLLNACGNGAHFNHSLWDLKMKTNVLYDESQPNGLSEIGSYWIGGIMAHIDALTALCCPTVNCYRRLHHPWSPDIKNWDFGDRMSSIRAKVKGFKGTLIENRLPSGCSNPYLTMAATIAAGIDGIENKIKPPPPGQSDAPKLAFCLADSLDALEKDVVLSSALGKQFVKWFLKIKRDVELVALMDSKPQEIDEEGLAKEREMYKYC